MPSEAMGDPADRANESNASVQADARGSGDSQERIAARAYELYLARGGTDGQAWDDWLAAERELSENRFRGELPSEG